MTKDWTRKKIQVKEEIYTKENFSPFEYVNQCPTLNRYLYIVRLHIGIWADRYTVHINLLMDGNVILVHLG